MSGTHTTTVDLIDVCSTQQTAACLPDDWKGEQVTVVRGVAPEGLVPAGDGTYYGPGRHVPFGWLWRWRGDSDWFDVPVYSSHLDRFVQARPAPEPRPRTERIEWWKALRDHRAVLVANGWHRAFGSRTRDDGDIVLTRRSHDGPLEVDLCHVHDDGMVEVLADDNPTGTTDDPPPGKATCGDVGPYGAECTRTTPHGLHRGWAGPDGLTPIQWRGTTHTAPELDTGHWEADEAWTNSGAICWVDRHGRHHALTGARLAKTLGLSDDPAVDEEMGHALAALVAAVRNQHTPDAP